MGWDYCYDWQKKSDIVQARTKSWENEERIHTCLEHSTSGNVLWTVWEVRNKVNGFSERFIGCDLLQYDRRDQCWGYKGMDESMGPYYYSVPQKFLDMVPEQNPEWRKQVQAHRDHKKVQAAKKRSVQIGQKWKLRDGCKPPVVQIVSNSPRIVGEYLGSRYRIAPRLLDCQIQ